MRLRRAPAGEGGGGVDRADPRPDPAVDLGPARRPPCRSGWWTTWRRRSATTRTRGSTGSGSASSCRPSCARSAARIRSTRWPSDLATHDTFARADGWLSDGAERAYDHYVGWALHLYPTLWARMAGAADLAAAAPRTRRRDARPVPHRRRRPGRRRRVAADPGPQPDLPVRRRGAVLGGRDRRRAVAVRRASCAGPPPASSTTSPSTARPTSAACSPWAGTRPWPRLAQSYSGPGLAVLGGQGHARARAAGRPSCVDGRRGAAARARTATTLRAVAGARAGSSVSTPRRRHRAGGQPRHRPRRRGRRPSPTPRSTPGSATRPRPAPCWTSAAGPSRSTSRSSLVDAAGRATHRSGMRTLDVRVDGDGPAGIGVAGSTADAHWVEPDPDGPDHGEGRPGGPTAGRPAHRLLARARALGGAPVPGGRARGRGRPDGRAAAGRRLARGRPARVTLDPATAAVTRRRAALAVGRAVRPRRDRGCRGVRRREPARRAASGSPGSSYPVAVGAWVCVLVELPAALAATPADAGRRSRSTATAASRLDVRVQLAGWRHHINTASAKTGPPVRRLRNPPAWARPTGPVPTKEHG